MRLLPGAAGGYFQTSGGDASVLLRLKEDYDGAEPAASSVAATNLLRLAALLPQGGMLMDGCIFGRVRVQASMLLVDGHGREGLLGLMQEPTFF